jgi:spore germination cell wall hydrolase CwlJ-like protein
MQFLSRAAGSAAVFLCTIVLGASSAPGQVLSLQDQPIQQPENVQTLASVPAPVTQLVVPAQQASSDTPDQAENDEAYDSLRQAVAAQQPYAALDEDARCLAIGVYYEAKGEPLAGQLAVAHVILNRSESGRFPKSVCGVLKQRGQFSFVHGGKLPQPRDNAQWREAVAVAQVAQKDLWQNPAPKALFFHARYVKPAWRLARVASLGNHIFYR